MKQSELHITKNNKPKQNPIKHPRFADICAGIGGFRLAFEPFASCVYSCEINKFARKTYEANFNISHPYDHDIKSIDAQDIPDHNILLAGFPCQPFSKAAYDPRNLGKKQQGFQCEKNGNIFFHLARIIHHKQPDAFLLENVPYLMFHNGMKTMKTIIQTLEDQLGYSCFFKTFNAYPFVPQKRERLFILGFKNNTHFTWNDMLISDKPNTLQSILHPQDGTEKPEPPYTSGDNATVNEKYTLSEKTMLSLEKHGEYHAQKGNGFGHTLVDPTDVARTLTAQYYKDGSAILVNQQNPDKTYNPLAWNVLGIQNPHYLPRKLTPRECARLMGFPDAFKIPVSDSQAYKQFGNSIVVPLVSEIAKLLTQALAP